MVDIAIVGVSFKLPQEAENEAGLWSVLEDRRNLMTEWPEDRLQSASFYASGPGDQNKIKSKGAHFLRQDAAAFDAPFFSITANDAAAMDPQHRLALETTYHAFENAGMPVAALQGSQTSVFAASFTDDYTRMLAKDPDRYPRTTVMGTAPSILANRISWYFDLSGPSMHIDTACSSSLVALDLACQSLKNGVASMALVVGTNMILGPEASVLLSNGDFLSPDGVCYSFDHRASGYARGEGIVSLLIKPVSEAVRDGDMIRAVIRSIGSNQDGRTPVISQPSAKAQEDLIRRVYRKAGLDFAPVRYVEAHGTGTRVGDPIEIEAIGKVFGAHRSASEPLYVGSVKSNIGHCEGSAGLAGVIKAMLVLEKAMIPPNALFECLNPNINAELNHIIIPTNSTPWPNQGLRRVSVNSFGFGGTNSHAVMDDAFHYLQTRCLNGIHHTISLPPPSLTNGHSSSNGHHAEPSGQPTNGHLANGHASKAHASRNGSNGHVGAICHSNSRVLVFSAPDEKSLKRVIQGYEPYYREHIQSSASNLSELAFTLAARRSHQLWRTCAVGDPEKPEKMGKLTFEKYTRASADCKTAFVFTGQGAQYTGMGLALLQYPVFRQTIDEANEALGQLGCPWSVIDELGSDSNIHKPEYSQPLCTILQIALVELLSSFGVVASAVVGHSSGEIAAAYTVGALSLASACKVAYFRGVFAGKLRNTASPGAMMSVNLAEDKVSEYFKNIESGRIWSTIVACINSPVNSTLSGPDEEIDAIQLQLDRDDIFARKLNTGVAYHSPSMQVIAAEYLDEMGELDSRDMKNSDTKPAVFSSVTGQLAAPKLLAMPQYWVENLVSPVLFSQALLALNAGELAVPDLIEVGPSNALRRPIQDTLSIEVGGNKDNIRYLSALQKSDDPRSTILQLAGRLFSQGYRVSIQAANEPQRGLTEGGIAAAIPFRTDCPRFPFDHSRKYWFESPLSRDFRLREPVPQSSLGARFQHWNPLEPTWRQLLSVEAIPWVKDHEVTGRVLYPGAGMIVMALEAAKQMCPADRELSGLFMKEAHFLNPIILAAAWEESTDAFIQLRPVRKAFEKQTVWYDVKITTQAEGRWTECFSASIRTDFEDAAATQIDGGTENQLMLEALLLKIRSTEEICTQPLDCHAFYKRCHEAGLRYGESFQLLKDIRWDGEHAATARINVTSAKHQIDSLVHPAVLDCALQLTGAHTSKGLSEAMSACVPSHLSDAWFSPQASSWQYPQTSRLRCSTIETSPPDARGTTSTAIYVSADDGSPLCAIGRLSMTMVSINLEGDRPNSHARKLLHGVRWMPQMSLLSPQELHRACDVAEVSKDEVHIENYRKLLDTALEDVLCNTMRRLSEVDRQRTPEFLLPYVSWAKERIKQRQAFTSQESDSPDSEISRADLEDRLEVAKETYPSWEIFPAVARNLENVLLGQIDPLQVAFDTGLAERFYIDLFEQTCGNKFRKLLDLMAHENPCMRILEVGAGTGSMTEQILTQLGNQRDGGVKFLDYTYTDVSPAFFEKAQMRFSRYADRMYLKTFDLERDALKQDLEAGIYDVVFAGSVLHATGNLAATIQNLHKLLKPGGRLILLEVVVPESIVTNFVFGLLPGWWRCSEPWRKLCPAINEQQWDTVLRENGFSGTDLVLRDYGSGACHVASIMVSTVKQAQDLPKECAPRGLLSLLVPYGSHPSDFGRLVDSWQAQLPAWDVQTISLKGLEDKKFAADDVVISFLEAGTPFLANMTESNFELLKHLIKSTRKLLWVSAADIGDSQYPQYNLMHGFLRSMRSENIDKRIISLSIESTAPVQEFGKHILAVFKSSFASPFPSDELEYWVLDGQISTLRAFEEEPVNSRVRSLTSAEPRLQAWQDVPPAMLSVSNPGSLDSLEFIQDPIHEASLGPDEIEIEAKAWGLNFRDVFVGLGRLTDDTDLGFDCVGVVKRIGSGYDSAIQVGDRVCGVKPGCMRTFPRLTSATVVKIPSAMSFEAAASVIAPGMTAYYSLIQISRLQKGEKVLIHSASGSTGQMAIWVAKSVGAEIFATVGYDEKKQLLIDEFGLPADHIFYSRNTSFAQGILRVTKGYGVDVILNSLSGSSLRASWECLAPYGRFVEIGKADIASNSSLPMVGFSRNISFTAVDLHHVAQTNPGLVGELVQKTINMVDRGETRFPSPLHVYPASKVEDAFRFLQSGRSSGRIVINISNTDVVPTRIRQTNSWAFEGNASYMICGGLGGLGRAIAQWMASKGARNLILPSRSGPQKSFDSAQTVLTLEEQGVEVLTPICDVSSAPDTAAMLEECARVGMPPLKGCINAAMVLQDAVFDNMSFAQWELTIRSKAQSSWNLHQALPADLDFFVLLSSLAGINGSVAQSNYAAGCTSQDALARFRNAHGHGRISISLDLGWMRNIGIIAETTAYQQVREAAMDMAEIEDAEFMALLDLICDPADPLVVRESRDVSQLLVGVVTPADRLAEGKPSPPLTQRPLFAAFSIVAGSKSHDDDPNAGAAGADDHAVQFRQAIMADSASPENHVVISKDTMSPNRIVMRALAEKLARALAITADDVEYAKRLDDYGVDSLVAVELRNWIAKDFSATVAVFDIMGGTSIAAIGDLVVERSEVRKGSTKNSDNLMKRALKINS